MDCARNSCSVDLWQGVHDVPCRAVGVSFITIAIKSLGGWSELAPKSISLIGHLFGLGLGISTSINSLQHFQRYSVSLCRGNAALWLHFFPPINSYIDSIICPYFLLLFRSLFYVCVLSSVFFLHLCVYYARTTQLRINLERYREIFSNWLPPSSAKFILNFR